jgi:hypothetical protein
VQNNPVNLIDLYGLHPIIKLSNKLWGKVMTGRPPYKRPRVKVYGDKNAKNYLDTKIFPDGSVKSKIGLKVPKSGIEKAKNALKVGLLFTASMLDPFGAEALANPEEDADGNGIPDYLETSTECK